MANQPDPIELYETAVQALAPLMNGVTAAQLSSDTRCSDWSVQSLINHALAVQEFANSVVTKSTPNMAAMGLVDHALPSKGAGAAFKLITDTTLAALKAANLEDTVTTPFGDMPGGNFIINPITDMIIHKWDLGKATGQDSTIDEALAELGLSSLIGSLSRGRDGGFFGPEVTVPASASVQDRLIAYSGRAP